MKTRPNILLIMGDQLAASALAAYGNKLVKTPNLDRIAAQGTVFENAYCPNPICCPSRAAMWSGLHTWHCEAWNNYKGLEPEAPTAFSRLRDHGYILAPPISSCRS